MFNFSEELIEETIKCFKEENDVEFSREQAIEVLGNLGGLYLTFSKIQPKNSNFVGVV